MLLIIISYNNEFSLNFSVDKDLNVNAKQFVKLFEEIIMNEILGNSDTISNNNNKKNL